MAENANPITAENLWNHKKWHAQQQGSNAIHSVFKHEFQIQAILEWQKLRKRKKDPSPTHSQEQYKVEWQPMTLEKWALPILQEAGLKTAHIEPTARSQNTDDTCQICWTPTSFEHTFDEDNYDDMPQCDTCLRTYHWKCLLHHNLCTPSQRVQADQCSSWDCPSCTNLSNSQKANRTRLAEEEEMIKAFWHPTWEPAEMLLANPDFDKHVQSLNNPN